MTVTDKMFLNPAPTTLSHLTKLTVIPQYFLVFSPCSVAPAVQASSARHLPVCFTVRRLMGGGLWKGWLWPGLRGIGPHELLFGLFQEQMWYLGLAI